MDLLSALLPSEPVLSLLSMKGKGQLQAISATFLYSTSIIQQKRDRLPGKKE